MQADLPAVPSSMPWHDQAWRQMRQSSNRGRLPHALLIYGPAGVGKRMFARRLTQFLLCTNPDTQAMQACGNCPSCAKLQHAAHPDMSAISIPADKREITVNEIRNLLTFIQLSPQISGGYKVAIIDPADRMNRNAANALLKTLEEPPANRIIVLVSEAPGRIPATIRSRCQQLRISNPDPDTALKWLRDSADGRIDAGFLERNDNAPLSALQAWRNTDAGEESNHGETEWHKQILSVVQGMASALDIARKWAELDSHMPLVRWLQRENLKSMHHLMGSYNADSGSNTQNFYQQAQFDLRAVLSIQCKINQLAPILESTLNKRLIWETFLLDCLKMVPNKTGWNRRYRNEEKT